MGHRRNVFESAIEANLHPRRTTRRRVFNFNNSNGKRSKGSNNFEVSTGSEEAKIFSQVQLPRRRRWS
ncbi:hypothetical protein Ahy_A05g025182 isoform A [Arachis hypogaea]|uniref:Uncharacterized protein n=1 Tax=Arachis hypogaea TaxID=3818 RepID=A0A445D8A4_ARAHY|nr:hypothetical protein Ahy_A05g025182 isoform A [Arachis hypogaea]